MCDFIKAKSLQTASYREKKNVCDKNENNLHRE